jgi:CelD/BcsL family acetyltransferase involved in cellulose biosynthesis
LRHSTERGRRRLNKAGEWRIDIVTQVGPALEAALAGYQRVYAQSWKPPEPCPGFIPGLVALAAERGWLRLGVLWLNGEPLAAQLWLTGGGKANIYKLAYAKGMEKFSAGSVLTQALMQHAMDVDRVTEVDYLSGDDAYKADWMALRRERVGLEAFDLRRPAGLLAAARHVASSLRKLKFRSD